MTFGIAILLLKNPKIRTRHGLTVFCSAIVLLLYMNVVREGLRYGDLTDYVQGAFDLHNHAPFNYRYIYPPLLATLCQPFLWLGTDGLTAGIWCLNWVGLALFFALLVNTLKINGISHRFAHLIVFLFMLVNVPVLRTLCYGQVNFHMMNLILLSCLTYPRHKALSACMLALAVHLKASPIIFALPFLYTRDMKWIIRFGVALVLLFALTYCFYGWQPFASFLANAKNIYAANGINFRECSIDAVVRTCAIFLGTNGDAWVPVVKIPVLIGLLAGVHYSIRKKIWDSTKGDCAYILNSLPPLLFVMVFASPLVWEHHFVFLSLPALLLLKKIRTSTEWVAYGFAYLLIMLIPAFDFFPLSFCRLVGAGILFCLCIRAARYDTSPGFTELSRKVG